MAHTPGPWVVKTGKHGWPRGIDAPADMQTKGGVGSVVRWNGIGFPSSPTAAANARLIAAAPEMLAMLSKILSGIDRGKLEDQTLLTRKGEEVVTTALSTRLRDIIAKATGQQS